MVRKLCVENQFILCSFSGVSVTGTCCNNLDPFVGLYDGKEIVIAKKDGADACLYRCTVAVLTMR